MSLPGNVTFPTPPLDAAHIECAARSLRPPAASLSVPCPVCDHFACRIYSWTDANGGVHEQGCELCQTNVLIRQGATPAAGPRNDLAAAVEKLSRDVAALQYQLNNPNP